MNPWTSQDTFVLRRKKSHYFYELLIVKCQCQTRYFSNVKLQAIPIAIAMSLMAAFVTNGSIFINLF